MNKKLSIFAFVTLASVQLSQAGDSAVVISSLKSDLDMLLADF